MLGLYLGCQTNGLWGIAQGSSTDKIKPTDQHTQFGCCFSQSGTRTVCGVDLEQPLCVAQSSYRCVAQIPDRLDQAPCYMQCSSQSDCATCACFRMHAVHSTYPCSSRTVPDLAPAPTSAGFVLQETCEGRVQCGSQTSRSRCHMQHGSQSKHCMWCNPAGVDTPCVTMPTVGSLGFTLHARKVSNKYWSRSD